MLTNYHKLSGSKPQMHHATDSVIGPSAQGLPSLWRLWGRMHFHVHSGCWQKAVPSRFRTEDLFTCWLSARGCLHSPSIPPHLQAHSCFQSLPPARESSLSLRAHVIPLIQWSIFAWQVANGFSSFSFTLETSGISELLFLCLFWPLRITMQLCVKRR